MVREGDHRKCLTHSYSCTIRENYSIYFVIVRCAHLKQMFACKKPSHLFASQQTTVAAGTRVLCKLPTDLSHSYDK